MRSHYEKFLIICSLLFSAPQYTLAQEAASGADSYNSNEEMMTIVNEETPQDGTAKWEDASIFIDANECIVDGASCNCAELNSTDILTTGSLICYESAGANKSGRIDRKRESYILIASETFVPAGLGESLAEEIGKQLKSYEKVNETTTSDISCPTGEVAKIQRESNWIQDSREDFRDTLPIYVVEKIVTSFFGGTLQRGIVVGFYRPKANERIIAEGRLQVIVTKIKEHKNVEYMCKKPRTFFGIDLKNLLPL
jgi:hypothetical protein